MYESGVQVVTADIVVQFVFNKGEGPSAKAYCTKSENEKIDKIFKWKMNDFI
jgi:hypothetical protein